MVAASPSPLTSNASSSTSAPSPFSLRPAPTALPSVPQILRARCPRAPQYLFDRRIQRAYAGPPTL
ncbi:hypothetical protein I551_8534 [Mycobacterium ulcerans str. Harvey]|uniref:Uncharacterized protein n=1 Tax=Mycobacterium ulcerans str. Harvey TaxID=1299332 RepID=A0ABN0RAY6_MYCUL|nr:hypothetical protein I551_8534 [Mycobacterium ulcerans str. Harvey]